MAKRNSAGRSSRDEEVSALYRGDLKGFTERRNELAKRLRREGETEAAEAVRRLPKPTAAAAALNQLSHSDPERRDALLRAGEVLRKVQEKLVEGTASGADAREAGQAEREVVADLVDAARRAGEDAGAPLSAAAAERVRETLHAVALDEDVRRKFEQGRLAEDHQAVGLGPLPATAPAAKAESRRAEDRAQKRRRDETAAAESEERDARRRLDAAERELERARRQADHAQRALAAASEALDEAREAANSAAARAQELRPSG